MPDRRTEGGPSPEPATLDSLHDVVASAPLGRIRRLDLGLEGDWSATATTIWDRDRGLIGIPETPYSHPHHRPSLELYYDGAWVGMHCFRRERELNVLDEALARSVIAWIESSLAG